MFCSNCGTIIDENRKFCPVCGSATVEASAEATTTFPEQQEQKTYINPTDHEAEAIKSTVSSDNSNSVPPYFSDVNPYYNNHNEQHVNEQSFNMPIYPPYFAQSIPDPGRDFAIASLVLGIVSYLLLCAFCFGWPSTFITTITGLVLGIKSKQKSKQVGISNGMATAGIVTSAIALACVAGICLLYLILFITGSELLDTEMMSELI